MRKVTENELNRSIMLADLFGGLVAAAFTGLFMAVTLYFFLGLGVGPK